eukprot:g7333.t1
MAGGQAAGRRSALRVRLVRREFSAKLWVGMVAKGAQCCPGFFSVSLVIASDLCGVHFPGAAVSVARFLDLAHNLQSAWRRRLRLKWVPMSTTTAKLETERAGQRCCASMRSK